EALTARSGRQREGAHQVWIGMALREADAAHEPSFLVRAVHYLDRGIRHEPRWPGRGAGAARLDLQRRPPVRPRDLPQPAAPRRDLLATEPFAQVPSTNVSGPAGPTGTSRVPDPHRGERQEPE